MCFELFSHSNNGSAGRGFIIILRPFSARALSVNCYEAAEIHSVPYCNFPPMHWWSRHNCSMNRHRKIQSACSGEHLVSLKNSRLCSVGGGESSCFHISATSLAILLPQLWLFQLGLRLATFIYAFYRQISKAKGERKCSFKTKTVPPIPKFTSHCWNSALLLTCSHVWKEMERMVLVNPSSKES